MKTRFEKQKNNKVLSITFWILFILAYTVQVISASNVYLPFLLTNILIFVLCAMGVCYRSFESISFKNIFLCFTIIFFVFIPLLELSKEVVYWGGSRLNIYNYVIGNLLVVIFVASFLSFYTLKRRANEHYQKIFTIDQKLSHKIKNLKTHTVIFMTFIVICIAYIVGSANNFNLISLLIRSGTEDRVAMENSSWLVFEYFLRPMIVWCLIIYTLNSRRNFILFSTLIIISLILVSPTGIARFLSFSLYFPLLLIFFPKLFKSYSLYYLSVIALFFVFPLLDKFRRISDAEISMQYDFSFLLHGHFDAFQNFIRLVQIDFVTYGKQLMGAFLFFIPRSWWPEKPVGTGHSISAIEGLELSNISMPLIGEAYANFWVFGVMLFGFFFGVIAAKLDSIFVAMGDGITLVKLLLLILMAQFVFILRGDLMSSFAYTTALTASFLSLVAILNFVNNLSLSRPRFSSV